MLDALDYVVGEHLWNFADFATAANIRRIDGNKKGYLLATADQNRLPLKSKTLGSTIRKHTFTQRMTQTAIYTADRLNDVRFLKRMVAGGSKNQAKESMKLLKKSEDPQGGLHSLSLFRWQFPTAVESDEI